MATPVAVSPLTAGVTSPVNIVFSAGAPSPGNKIVVVFWAGFGTTPAVSSVVDLATSPNTFSAGPSDVIAGTQGIWLYWLDLPGGATWTGSYTVRVTFGTAPTDSEAGGLAYSGCATGAPSATNHGQDAVGSTAATSGSISPAGTGLYVGGIVTGSSSGTATLTAGSGFTNRFSQPNGAGFWAGAGADIPSSSGSKAATWTIDSSPWNALVAFWTDAAGGAAAMPQIAHGFGPN